MKDAPLFEEDEHVVLDLARDPLALDAALDEREVRPEDFRRELDDEAFGERAVRGLHVAEELGRRAVAHEEAVEAVDGPLLGLVPRVLLACLGVGGEELDGEGAGGYG